jgi:hypothetical protein
MSSRPDGRPRLVRDHAGAKPRAARPLETMFARRPCARLPGLAYDRLVAPAFVIGLGPAAAGRFVARGGLLQCPLPAPQIPAVRGRNGRQGDAAEERPRCPLLAHIADVRLLSALGRKADAKGAMRKGFGTNNFLAAPCPCRARFPCAAYRHRIQVIEHVGSAANILDDPGEKFLRPAIRQG